MSLAELAVREATSGWYCHNFSRQDLRSDPRKKSATVRVVWAQNRGRTSSHGHHKASALGSTEQKLRGRGLSRSLQGGGIVGFAHLIGNIIRVANTARSINHKDGALQQTPLLDQHTIVTAKLLTLMSGE